MSTTTGMSRRHRLEQQRHVVAVCVAAATLTATLVGWAPSSGAAWAIVIASLAVGLPHGALDVVIGPRLTRPRRFFGIYLTTALVIVLAWLALPALGVVAFFTSSWFHFARGDAVHHRGLAGAGDLVGVSTAGCAIGLPLMLHAGIVTPVLSDLMLGTAALTSDQVALWGSIIAVPALVAGVLASVAALRTRRYEAILEIAIIAAVAATVHPLVSFAIYFALWHAPRHLITLDIDRRAWFRTVSATAATLLAGACVWWLIEPASPAVAQIVFIGLAALTGPHLVLTESLRSRTMPLVGLRSGPTVHRRGGRHGLSSPTRHRRHAHTRSRSCRPGRNPGWPRSARLDR